MGGGASKSAVQPITKGVGTSQDNGDRDLAPMSFGELQLVQDKMSELKSLLHTVTKEKERLESEYAMNKAELEARIRSEEKALRESVENKLALEELKKEKAAAEAAEATSRQQQQENSKQERHQQQQQQEYEEEVAAAKALAQEAQAQLSAWEHERTRLRDEAQQWAARYHESRAKLERFSEEAAQISKEAIQRAAHMDVMREKAFIMQEEERARFASMEAELDEMRRMVREKEENEAANGGHRPEDVIGQVVRLFGLTGARRLNDKVGLCTARDPDSGRYVVQLRGAEAETVKVKGANLDMHTQPSRFMWQQVRLVGLVGSAHLNGAVGVCSELDRVTGRLVVLLDGDDEKVVKVREENLEELSEREREEYDARRAREVREKHESEAKQRLLEKERKQAEMEAEAVRRQQEAAEAAERQLAAETERQLAEQAEAERQLAEARLESERLAAEAELQAQRAAQEEERIKQEKIRLQEEQENQRMLLAFADLQSGKEQARRAEEMARAAEEQRLREERREAECAALQRLQAEQEQALRQKEEAQRAAAAQQRERAWQMHLQQVHARLNEPALGVSLAYLQKFLERFECAGLSTGEVVHDIVMEQTKTQQCSYAQHVMIQEATPQHLVEFGRATHYVSHAWRGSFEEMVAALGHWLQHDWDGQKDTVYFFLDVIACNHHVSVWGEGAHKLGPDQVVGDRVRACGRVLVVLSPFTQPIAYRRMWVLFEVAVAVQSRASLAACVSPAEAPRLHASLQGDMDPVRMALATLDGKSAETSVVHDRTMLLVYIKKTIGFDKLNDMVADAMRSWLVLAGYKQLYQEESQHGPDTHAAASLLNNVACLLKNQGKTAEAEKLFLRAIRILEKLLGEDHPEVGLVVSNLAGLLKQCGRMAEAAPLIRRYLNIHEKAAKRDNRQVAMQLNLLAKALRMEGRYDEARELYERSLAVREQCLGRWHPNVATSLNNLGAMLTSIGVYADAEPLLNRALEIDRKVYGRDHPRVATDFNNLAVLYNAMGRVGEAEKLCTNAVKIIQNASGKFNDPDIAAILNTLGWVYGCSNRTQLADEQFERALHICSENKFNDDHPVMMRVRGGFFVNTARRSLAAGQPEDARVSLAAARPLLEEVRGKLHYETKHVYAMIEILDNMESG